MRQKEGINFKGKKNQPKQTNKKIATLLETETFEGRKTHTIQVGERNLAKFEEENTRWGEEGDCHKNSRRD